MRLAPSTQPRFVGYVTEKYPEVQIYYPLYLRRSRPARTRHPIQIPTPVFPGYIFAKIQTDSVIVSELTNTPIRAFFVKFGPDLGIVPEWEIERIRRLESLNQLVKITTKENPYRPGTKIRIMHTLLDIDAIIIYPMGQDRALVRTESGKFVVPISKIALAGG